MYIWQPIDWVDKLSAINRLSDIVAPQWKDHFDKYWKWSQTRWIYLMLMVSNTSLTGQWIPCYTPLVYIENHGPRWSLRLGSLKDSLYRLISLDLGLCWVLAIHGEICRPCHGLNIYLSGLVMRCYNIGMEIVPQIFQFQFRRIRNHRILQKLIHYVWLASLKCIHGIEARNCLCHKPHLQDKKR